MLEAIAGEDIQGVLGVMIPIVAIVGGISLAGAIAYMRSKERMEMISRGMDVSKFDVKFDLGRRRRSPLRGGFMWLGAGIGLLLAYYLCHTVFVGQDNDVIYFGMVATFVGLGLLLSHFLDKQDPADGGNKL